MIYQISATFEITDPVLPEASGEAALPKTGGIQAGLFYALESGLAALGVVLKKKNK